MLVNFPNSAAFSLAVAKFLKMMCSFVSLIERKKKTKKVTRLVFEKLRVEAKQIKKEA